MLTESRRMKEVLTNNGYNLTYPEAPGIHNWDFWDDGIQKVITWLMGEK